MKRATASMALALAAAAFAAGCAATMCAAHYVGPATKAGESGVLVSYRYGDLLWLNLFYGGDAT